MASWSDRIVHEAGYVAKGSRLLGRFLRARPFLCNWQITYRCNFRCEICSFWKEGHHPSDELGLGDVTRIADKLRPLAPLVISMAGGEPLLRKDLPEICRILSRDHYFTIITNGWHATAQNVGALYEAGLQDAHVSIDSSDPAQHDALRGMSGSFERAVRAVELLRDTRPDRRHRVHVLSVLYDDNVEQVEGLIRLAQRLGVSFELSLYSDRRGELPDRRPRQSIGHELADLKKRYPETFVAMGGYLAGMDDAVGPSGVAQCRAGRTFFNIDDQGQVARCIDRNAQPVGSLLTDPLDVLLERLADEQRFDPCSGCWTSCRGFADVMAGPVGVARTLPDFYRAVRPL